MWAIGYYERLMIRVWWNRKNHPHCFLPTKTKVTKHVMHWVFFKCRSCLKVATRSLLLPPKCLCVVLGRHMRQWKARPFFQEYSAYPNPIQWWLGVSLYTSCPLVVYLERAVGKHAKPAILPCPSRSSRELGVCWLLDIQRWMWMGSRYSWRTIRPPFLSKPFHAT